MHSKLILSVDSVQAVSDPSHDPVFHCELRKSPQITGLSPVIIFSGYFLYSSLTFSAYAKNSSSYIFFFFGGNSQLYVSKICNSLV